MKEREREGGEGGRAKKKIAVYANIHSNVTIALVHTFLHAEHRKY